VLSDLRGEPMADRGNPSSGAGRPSIGDMAAPLLELLGPDGAQALRLASRRRQFRRREILFREGDVATSVHVIERGHVIVRAEGALDESVTLAVLGPGDHFGEIAVLSDDPRRSATVEALDVCVTREVPAEHFRDLRDRQPMIRRAMAESLARTNRRLVERLLDARHLDARGRLVVQLGRLHELFAGPIPFTQDDLASYVGVSRVTVNQILSALADEGMVTVGRGRVHVVEPSAAPRQADA
jgi:CRP-like cAMP-binding protein